MARPNADPQTLPGLANELADLASVIGDLAGDLASIAMALDGGEQVEPNTGAAMTFRPDCVMGKLELELAALRGALELCQAYAARMHKRL